MGTWRRDGTATAITKSGARSGRYRSHSTSEGAESVIGAPLHEMLTVKQQRAHHVAMQFKTDARIAGAQA